VDDAEDLLYYMQGVADAVIDSPVFSSSDPF
jgi:hypothetical protein